MYSLIEVNDPSTLLWSVKPAEEGIGNGLITRWWNFNSNPVKTAIKLSQPVIHAWQTSHIETNEKKLQVVTGSVPVSFNPYQINTYRLRTKIR